MSNETNNENEIPKGFVTINFLEEADKFVKDVVPEGSHPSQFLDMKKAFLCGLVFGYNITVKGLDFDNQDVAEKQLHRYNMQVEELEKHIMDGFKNFKE